MKKVFIKIWPLLCILGVWFIFSSPYFLEGLVPFSSKYLVTFFPPWNTSYGMPVKNNAMPDVITQLYPWRQLVIESWKQGQVPGWNPYQFAGSPLLANVQSSVFSPFNLLFFLFAVYRRLEHADPFTTASGRRVYVFVRKGNSDRHSGSIGIGDCIYVLRIYDCVDGLRDFGVCHIVPSSSFIWHGAVYTQAARRIWCVDRRFGDFINYIRTLSGQRISSGWGRGVCTVFGL